LSFPEDRKQPREGERLTESYEIFNVLRSLNILRIVAGARVEVLENDRSRSRKEFFATICSAMSYFPFSKIVLQVSVWLAVDGRFFETQGRLRAPEQSSLATQSFFALRTMQRMPM
jgi:hypothetical protein